MIRVERARAPMPPGVLAAGYRHDGAGVIAVRPGTPPELAAAVVRAIAAELGPAEPPRP